MAPITANARSLSNDVLGSPYAPSIYFLGHRFSQIHTDWHYVFCCPFHLCKDPHSLETSELASTALTFYDHYETPQKDYFPDLRYIHGEAAFGKVLSAIDAARNSVYI